MIGIVFIQLWLRIEVQNKHAFQKVHSGEEAHDLWQLEASVMMAEALMTKVLPKPSDTPESRHYLHSLTVTVTSLSVPWIDNCPISATGRQLPRLCHR